MPDYPNKITLPPVQGLTTSADELPVVNMVTDTIAELVVAMIDETNELIDQQIAITDYVNLLREFADGVMNQMGGQTNGSWLLDTGLDTIIMKSVQDGVTKVLPPILQETLQEVYLNDDIREAQGTTKEDITSTREQRKSAIESAKNVSDIAGHNKKIAENSDKSIEQQETFNSRLEDLAKLTESDMKDRRDKFEQEEQNKARNAEFQKALTERYGGASKSIFGGMGIEDIMGLPDDSPVKKQALEALEEQERKSKQQKNMKSVGDILGDLSGKKGMLGDLGKMLGNGELTGDLTTLLGGEGSVGVAKAGGLLEALGGSRAIASIASYAPEIVAGIAAVKMADSAVYNYAKDTREATSAGQTYGAKLQSDVGSSFYGFIDPTMSGAEYKGIYNNAFNAGLKGQSQADAIEFQTNMLRNYGVNSNVSFKAFSESVNLGTMSMEELQAEMEELSDTAKKSNTSLTGMISAAESFEKAIAKNVTTTEGERKKYTKEMDTTLANAGMTDEQMKYTATVFGGTEDRVITANQGREWGEGEFAKEVVAKKLQETGTGEYVEAAAKMVASGKPMGEAVEEFLKENKSAAMMINAQANNAGLDGNAYLKMLVQAKYGGSGMMEETNPIAASFEDSSAYWRGRNKKLNEKYSYLSSEKGDSLLVSVNDFVSGLFANKKISGLDKYKEAFEQNRSDAVESSKHTSKAPTVNVSVTLDGEKIAKTTSDYQKQQAVNAGGLFLTTEVKK